MKRLEGKVALVTGGTSGIGAGAVQRLCAEGARVVFTGSNRNAADAVCSQTGAEFVSHNVRDGAAWDALSARIANDYGRLDFAFANAGTEHGDGSVEDISLEGWENVIGVNQTGAMLTVQHAMRLMAKNPDGPTGSILVNSSMNAHRAMGNFVAYSVSKAAVVALVKSAAVHAGNRKYGIRVNAILPGVVETALIRNLIETSGDPATTRAAYEGLSPFGRMARVEEIAGLVAWFASDESQFVSGSEYVIDGATTAGMMGV
ncbi:3(or 17)beta-hydroxysteroid dehydrogenase [Novosphingobium sp. PhB57]|uniref:SDR family NAD(P)-dependent oxidoreductase n=1 Tax=unclassified Novosphingobium TaxID=2644732 RepID=UPI0010485C55|nr:MULTISPECIES: SDR family oxidoreductase [unclassified Novosphingobium]TCU57353.1 3(or 17)beta-hydroxysteroid dehydrogenase [Novosphingobium sp. PhB57]TDW67323.1 3(or 17)beta-hydroxysteroid dehydrogenase [Novosphingobium sp. PhB55]